MRRGRHWAMMIAALLPGAGALDAQVAPHTGPGGSPRAPLAPPTLIARADEVIGLLRGDGDYRRTFAPVFIAQVPPERFAAIAAQLRQALGEPVAVADTHPAGPFAGTVTLGFARGTATVQLTLDPDGAHRVTGLLITGTQTRDDSAAKLVADFRALPGQAGFGIYDLGAGEPRPIAEWHGAAGAPIGSVFKLWLLAEASRQVQAGERRWTDVVPVGAPSLPSGMVRDWPAGSPVTLHTLATLMISISDNTAADTMLALLGRDRVGQLAIETRSVEAERLLPVLSTREAFLVKADATLRTSWPRATADERRALLADNAAAFATAPLSLAGTYGDGRPLAPETVEWFASPLQTARLLDWVRVHGDDTARAILAVNGGIDPFTRARFDYVGFKGGSEPGVITLNYLVHARNGRWLAVTGNWHRTDGDTPMPAFASLMKRALELAAN